MFCNGAGVCCSNDLGDTVLHAHPTFTTKSIDEALTLHRSRSCSIRGTTCRTNIDVPGRWREVQNIWGPGPGESWDLRIRPRLWRCAAIAPTHIWVKHIIQQSTFGMSPSQNFDQTYPPGGRKRSPRPREEDDCDIIGKMVAAELRKLSSQWLPMVKMI